MVDVVRVATCVSVHWSHVWSSVPTATEALGMQTRSFPQATSFISLYTHHLPLPASVFVARVLTSTVGCV
uniref:Uncharacterized protein n=1 Tax=Ciona intestinalis TaxID=7719 RepID=H2Y1S5_CIOIN